MARIIIADNPLNEISIAKELLPPSLTRSWPDTAAPEFKAALADAVCLVGFGDGTMDDAFYKSAPNLKLVQLLSAGYDRCDIEAARRAGVPICNNGGANSTAVSEHAHPADARGLPAPRLAAHQRRRRPLARQQRRRRQALRTERPDPRHRRPRHHRQEDRAAGAGVRHARAVLRRRPAERGTRRRARRAVRAVRGGAADLRHRLAACAAAARRRGT